MCRVNANNTHGFGYIDTRTTLAAQPDYSVVKDIGIQHHFAEIHRQLQRDQDWVSLSFAVQCIELLRQAAEAYAQAEHERWKPKS